MMFNTKQVVYGTVLAEAAAALRLVAMDPTLAEAELSSLSALGQGNLSATMDRSHRNASHDEDLEASMFVEMESKDEYPHLSEQIKKIGKDIDELCELMDSISPANQELRTLITKGSNSTDDPSEQISERFTDLCEMDGPKAAKHLNDWVKELKKGEWNKQHVIPGIMHSFDRAMLEGDLQRAQQEIEKMRQLEGPGGQEAAQMEKQFVKKQQAKKEEPKKEGPKKTDAVKKQQAKKEEPKKEGPKKTDAVIKQEEEKKQQ